MRLFKLYKIKDKNTLGIINFQYSWLIYICFQIYHTGFDNIYNCIKNLFFKLINKNLKKQFKMILIHRVYITLLFDCL